MHHRFPRMTADEAAAMIPHGATVGFSGFTAAGVPKAVPLAIAHRARQLRAQGDSYQIGVLTGASTGPALDETLAEADAIAWRSPFQSSSTMRRRINAQQAQFIDLHLSHVPQMIEHGILGKIDFAVIEAVDLTPHGHVYLSTGVGTAASYLRHAEKVFIEINHHHSPRLAEMHDIFVLPKPPRRAPLNIRHPLDRIGRPFATVDPRKIAGVIDTDFPDGLSKFDEPSAASDRIAEHIVRFLVDEMRAGRLPEEFLPVQSR